MEQILFDFIYRATTIEKGIFLMIAGVSFVFIVQVVFYLTVKLWPRGKIKEE
jgi:Na+-transporting methylmalonyl-CoA/oxaloacetate decarboxylase gamma subunit